MLVLRALVVPARLRNRLPTGHVSSALGKPTSTARQMRAIRPPNKSPIASYTARFKHKKSVVKCTVHINTAGFDTAETAPTKACSHMRDAHGLPRYLETPTD